MSDAAVNAPKAPVAPPGGGLPMIVTLGLVAMLSGFLVVLVFQFTAPVIEANKQELIGRAVFQVVPRGAVVRRDWLVTEAGVVPATRDGEGIHLYAAYDAHGDLRGFAAESAAQGYADIIRVLFGYDPACQCITGNYVLKSAETPGLGDKIFKDAAFLANFEALDARLAPDGQGLAHPIVTVKHGTKQHPWEIDAISGATISSKAVGRALDKGAQALLPKVMKHLDAIRHIEGSVE